MITIVFPFDFHLHIFPSFDHQHNHDIIAACFCTTPAAAAQRRQRAASPTGQVFRRCKSPKVCKNRLGALEAATFLRRYGRAKEYWTEGRTATAKAAARIE
jgi:hypothetical protein